MTEAIDSFEDAYSGELPDLPKHRIGIPSANSDDMLAALADMYASGLLSGDAFEAARGRV
jgi:hypothetical protein